MQTTRSSQRKRKIPVPHQNDSQPRSPPTTVLRFEISDFEDLSHPKGSFVETRSVQASPHPDRSWQLRVYPRGHQRSRSDKVLVSCFLTARRASGNATADGNDKSTDDLEFSFRIKDWRMPPRRCGFKTNLAYGFMGHTRDAILERGLNQDGALVVDVTLTFWSADDRRPDTKRRIRHLSLGEQLLRSPGFADIAFCVGPNKAVVRAHGCVLAVRARPLLELALLGHDGTTGDDIPPLELPRVEEDVFRAFLDYVYTCDRDRLCCFVVAGRDGDPGTALSLLEEADKFGACDLKRVLESVLVDRFLSPSNCCEMLLWADSHWCALLKEAAANVFCSDPIAATTGKNHGWKMLRKSPELLSQLVIRYARRTKSKTKDRGMPPCGSSCSSNNNSKDGILERDRNRRRCSCSCRCHRDLSVGELRERLEEAGLDPDGSRKMLVRRLAGLER